MACSLGSRNSRDISSSLFLAGYINDLDSNLGFSWLFPFLAFYLSTPPRHRQSLSFFIPLEAPTQIHISTLNYSPSSFFIVYMQRRGTHLFSLPSALKKRGSNSTLNSSNDSAVSPLQSPETHPVPLPTSSSRSSLADSSSIGDHVSIYHDWSLLSISRVSQSPGMVLVALYHLPTSTMYTWPLQTDPKAPQPKQGTVFIAAMTKDGSDNAQIMSESLKILTGVLTTWIRQKSQIKSKVKLGEREQDTEQLSQVLGMPKIDDAQRLAILDKQVVRPIQEWSGISPADSKGKQRVLSSLNSNINTKSNREAQSAPKLAIPQMPSIEISSPNSTDRMSKQKAPWLQERKQSYVS